MHKYNQLYNNKDSKFFRRRLRKNLTPAEATLWKSLKTGRLMEEGSEGSSVLEIISWIFSVQKKNWRLNWTGMVIILSGGRFVMMNVQHS